ncbi:MAG: CBS domain-containing protein, partial [Firmicutes bacterium]|nr:CBS domain-containing protein [Bacillota bacterium]
RTVEYVARLGARLAEDVPVLVTPTIPFGISPHHMVYGGTISLRVETLLHVLEDVCGAVVAHGFGRILILNVGLAAFNLLPAFPLDGGRVLRAILWSFLGLERATRVSTSLGHATAAAFIALGVLAIFTGRPVDGLWLVLIGWFLDQGAGASYQQMLLRHALRGVRVRDIMTPDPVTLEADLTLEEAVAGYFLPRKHGGYPVVYGDRLLGILTLHDLKQVPRERWSTTRVREAMTPIDRAQTVRPEAPAYDALARMVQAGVGRLLVLDAGGELVGILTRSDLLHLIRLRSELRD